MARRCLRRVDRIKVSLAACFGLFEKRKLNLNATFYVFFSWRWSLLPRKGHANFAKFQPFTHPWCFPCSLTIALGEYTVEHSWRTIARKGMVWSSHQSFSRYASLKKLQVHHTVMYLQLVKWGVSLSRHSNYCEYSMDKLSIRDEHVIAL